MPERKIASLFRIKGRFLRSVRIERDFTDPGALESYVPTAFARDCAGRLAGGTRPASGQRAWRLTGDYGSGKSSFALLMAHWFAGREACLPSRIRSVVNPSKAGGTGYLPVLVTANREALNRSILVTLEAALRNAFGSRSKRSILSRLAAAVDTDPLSDQRTLELIVEANRELIVTKKAKGLILVIDELGKFLEHAAGRPESQDVFFLQGLAEEACRSGEQPFFLLCLLHQGFSAYAHDLSPSAQREWEKVAGRFEEIVFAQPVEQLAEVVTSALGLRQGALPETLRKSLPRLARKTFDLGWFGPADRRRLPDLAPALYPLHPALLPVLIRAFRRFGQNERSLFGFLLSSEPLGLQSFAAANPVGRLYGLAEFYDYLRTNLGHRLTGLSSRSYWTLIESVIDSYAGSNARWEGVLKTVGVLNLLGDSDLTPTREAIIHCVAGSDSRRAQRVGDDLEQLRKQGVLHNRGRARGFCLWPHTSVDLDRCFEEARRAVVEPRKMAPGLLPYLNMRPLVPRRHYLETGNLRYFEVRYCPVSRMPALLTEPDSEADGVIMVPLVESDAERTAALSLARDPAWKKRGTRLVAVPRPLGSLVSLLTEVQRWEWVRLNTPELNGDKYAREEVNRKISIAHDQLVRRLQSLVGLPYPEEPGVLCCYRQGREVPFDRGRGFMAFLSDILDQEYHYAPILHNELVNRHHLSAAAAAARQRLIEGMFASPGKEALGMDLTKRPPEMSMYLTILHRTQLHRKTRKGDWKIAVPAPSADPCNLRPVFVRIRQLLEAHSENRIDVAQLTAALRKKPYGLRAGVFPLLVSAFAIEHDKDLVFYKDGTFQREMGAEAMQVMIKAPARFELQYCRIEGVRAELFVRLCDALDCEKPEGRDLRLLDIVKPLCRFVARLPDYARRTHRLSPAAVQVREVILGAREPAPLIFVDLPRACGVELPLNRRRKSGKETEAYVRTLKRSLEELRASFPELQERLRRALRSAFPSMGSFEELRHHLATRAEALLPGLTDRELNAFCLRAADAKRTETEWLESIGSCLALKPPSKWDDACEVKFTGELAVVAERFHRVESAAFGDKAGAPKRRGIRLAVTRSDGREQTQVIQYSHKEAASLDRLRREIEKVLKQDRQLGLAALSEVAWTLLQQPGGEVAK